MTMRENFLDFMQRELNPDTLLIACGLPASYKTETTEVIAELKDFTILRTDMIRLNVLKNEDIFDEKVASNMVKRELVYDEMFKRADELAAKRQGLILDATFITQSLRKRAASIAAKHGKDFVIQETRCPREVSLSRISKRTKENYESNALTEQAYLNNKNRFEAVNLDEFKGLYPTLHSMHLIVDTTSDLSVEWIVIAKEIR